MERFKSNGFLGLLHYFGVALWTTLKLEGSVLIVQSMVMKHVVKMLVGMSVCAIKSRKHLVTVAWIKRLILTCLINPGSGLVETPQIESDSNHGNK